MIDPNEQYKKLIKLLDDNNVEYKLFEHRSALTYEDLSQVQKETGFFGTEGKCMILKADSDFIVYVTLQGKRIDMDLVKKVLSVSKLKLANQDELKEFFGAEPGCAYPFGFDKKYAVFVDPKIYEQEWFLFSPVLPTRTVQAKGSDLKRVFSSLENQIREVIDWNQ